MAFASARFDGEVGGEDGGALEGGWAGYGVADSVPDHDVAEIGRERWRLCRSEQVDDRTSPSCCVWLFFDATKKDKKGENYLVLNGHKVQ